MQVRKFRKEDISQIPNLIKRAIIERDNHNYTHEQIVLSSSYYTAEKFCEDFDNKIVYVCVDEDKVVGTGTLYKGEIMACFILPEYQGKGIGKEIVMALEKEAIRKGLPKVWLVSVLSAVKFYEKLGYVFVNEKMHRDWGKGMVMEKIF